jgi:hypothetical protein
MHGVSRDHQTVMEIYGTLFSSTVRKCRTKLNITPSDFITVNNYLFSRLNENGGPKAFDF